MNSIALFNVSKKKIKTYNCLSHGQNIKKNKLKKNIDGRNLIKFTQAHTHSLLSIHDSSSSFILLLFKNI